MSDGEPTILPDPDRRAWPRTVIAPRQPKPRGKSIWVTSETYDRLLAIRARTGHPIRVIVGILVERAK